MAQCFTCKKALTGSWNMPGVGTEYEKTGRYLGIGDGYFLYGDQPNWVYCYCKPCWQRAIITLPFIPNAQQQQLTSLQQQLTASQESHAALQRQHTSLQEQLLASQAESACYKEQLDETSERYNELSNRSGITKLRDLFRQLTAPQTDALHTHTKFRVDAFETAHSEQQLQCFTQFVQSTLTQLEPSVDAVIQLQKSTLAQRKQAKESVFQTLTNAGVPRTIIDMSIKHLETEIEQIEADIVGWNTFSAVLINVMEQSKEKTSEVEAKSCVVQEKSSELGY